MKKQIETNRLILKLQTSENSRYEMYSYAIECSNDSAQKAVGTALAIVHREDGAVQLTIVINDDCQHQGFGLEAGDALIEELILCFPKLEILAIVPENSGVQNDFCRRLGFELEYSDYLSEEDQTLSNFYYM